MPRIPSNPEDAGAFAAFSTESWQNLDGFYSVWVERWRRVMDYIRSNHWNALREMDEKVLPKWREYPTIDFTLAQYDDYLKQWMQSKIRYSVTPDLPTPSKIDQADLADHLLRFAWDKLEMDQKRADLGAWLLSTGNGDLRTYWNTNTGNMMPLAIPDPKDPEKLIPINPETLQPDPGMGEPIMVDAGEIGCEVISPQFTRWSLDKAHGVQVGYLVSYDEAINRWGEDVAKELSFSKPSGTLSTDLLSIANGMTRASQEESALVIEHYLPRSSRFSRGLWWTSSNRTSIVKPAPLPSRFEPITHFRWIPMPGHPTLGMSPLYGVTFQNKQYEKVLARSMEWMNKVVPKVLLKAGGGLKVGDWTEEPSQELAVNPGAEPEYTQIPAPPNIFAETRQELAEIMRHVAGYSNNRQKELPPGEATSRMRQPPRMVNEGEQVSLALINSSASWKRQGYVLLDYFARFYTDQRTVAVTGPDRIYQWRDFKGEMLKDFSGYLHVDEVSLYPWNKQSLKDSVIALLNTKAAEIMFTSPDGQMDRERLDVAMEATGFDVASSTLDPDVMEARNENHLFRNLEEGQEGPQVMGWQNNSVHMAEHTKELKGMGFKSWPKPRQDAFLQHVQQHEQVEADSAKQASDQMLAQEQQLRQIRSEAETQQDVRTAFGEKMIEMLVEVLAPKLAADGKSDKKKS